MNKIEDKNGCNRSISEYKFRGVFDDFPEDKEYGDVVCLKEKVTGGFLTFYSDGKEWHFVPEYSYDARELPEIYERRGNSDMNIRIPSGIR